MWFCPPDVWGAALLCAVMGAIAQSAGGLFIGFMILDACCVGCLTHVIMACLDAIVKCPKHVLAL